MKFGVCVYGYGLMEKVDDYRGFKKDRFKWYGYYECDVDDFKSFWRNMKYKVKVCYVDIYDKLGNVKRYKFCNGKWS